MKKLFKDYGLSLTLLTLFLVSWLGHGFYEWQVFENDQKEHQQEVSTADFFNVFARATLENWQSEFLQLFTMVVLTAHLSHKGSPESKDNEEKTKLSLKRIEKKVEVLLDRRN